jgi:anti-sigma B factor antagonist
LRAGAPATKRRTPVSITSRADLAGSASSHADDDDRLRLPPASPACNSKTGKKESTGRRFNRHCPPYAKPSSNSSFAYHRNDARAAENGFATKSRVGSVLSAGRYTQEAPMKIETRKIHDVLVVDMSGTLDSTSSGEAGDRIVNVAEGEHKRVLLNLAELEYVSSAGLRVILRGAKLLQGKRGELKICNAKGPVRDVLETSGFKSLIKVYDTEQEAFSAFL